MGKNGIPLGPRVTLTALARTSTPLRMLALPSFENLISLCAPLVREGCLALAAARRRDREEVVDRRCIVLRKREVEEKEKEKKKRRWMGRMGETLL